MNNLLLAAIIVAGTSVIWFGAHRRVSDARAELAILETDRLAQAERANAAEAEARKLEASLEEEKARAASLQAAAEKLSAENPPEPPAPTSPTEEGFWPEVRPYFYLSKRHLESIRYWPITDSDTISESAATLLGMSSAERAEVNRGYREVREEIRELEASLAYSTNAPVSLSEYKGEKKSIFVPELPNEELEKIDANFRARLAQALGTQRGELLARRIAETYDWGAFGMGVNRVITLIKDEEFWRLAVNAGGNFTISHQRDEEGKSRVPRDYAHFFPEEARNGKPD